MKHHARLLVSSLASSFVALASCGGVAPPPATAQLAGPIAPAADPATRESKGVAQRDARTSRDARPLATEEAPMSRSVGDFVVYRFSGAFRKAPSTLTERVIAREGNLFTIDFTLRPASDAGSGQTLRVRLNYGAGARVDVLDVAAIDGKGAEQPARVEDYDAMMAKTVLLVDDNEGVTHTEKLGVDVTGHAIACEKTTYSVMLGARRATMSVTQATGFAWGDVGDEITGVDGTLFYRAELVEIGSTNGAATPVLAQDD